MFPFYPWQSFAWLAFGFFLLAVFLLVFLRRFALWRFEFHCFAELVLSLSVALALIGGSEYLARYLSNRGWIAFHQPMQTMLPRGTEDWRLAHITADIHREADPVLFWKPKAEWPYSTQRLKGPEVAFEQEKKIFRLMSYGDSNTDGPATGAWPERLQLIFEQKHPGSVQVLNAGVAGYSSHQGLLRFRQQVSEYQPDLITVSFGWNDLASTLGKVDREFKAPSGLALNLQETLLRYRSFLVLKYLLRRFLPRSSAQKGHRVPAEDYLDNMRQFLELAQEHGAEVVFLTRVTQKTENELRSVKKNWRSKVPDYNDFLREFTRERGAYLIDVQRVFEQDLANNFADECHFNAKGHQKMADLVYTKLFSLGVLSDKSSFN